MDYFGATIWQRKSLYKTKRENPPEQFGGSNTSPLEDSRCLNIYTPVGSYKNPSSSLLPTPPFPLFNLSTGMLDALSQSSPLNCSMVKCLQFYISYFRGVEGTGTTVAHCECMSGRGAQAEGRKLGGGGRGIKQHLCCNWKNLDS